MKNFILLFTVFTSMITLSSCKKDDKPDPTSLELIVKDNRGNVISGALVELYATKDDWINETNQIGETQFTNEKGIVKFSDLMNLKYYFYVESDCFNNVNGLISTPSNLTVNTNNVSNVILSATGTLKFTSTSNNPYRVYVNGAFVFDMNGGATRYLSYMPTGSYSLRVLQLSGYFISPTDESYTGILNCGNTLHFFYPQSKGDLISTSEIENKEIKKIRRYSSVPEMN
jgi:hypothetical protein